MESLPFGDLLKALRKRRKISQQELARRIGKHLNTIGSWERGDCLPDTKGMVLELAKQLHLDNDDTRQFLEASLTALSSYWHVPYQRNPFFTGRQALLETLHQRLRSEQSVVLNQSYALSGLGGIGKTQLALEYVYQHALDYAALFWIAAETSETLSAGFAAIASQLQLPERDEKEAEKVVQAVLRWLNTHKEWLLIFDNVVSVELLKPFLPTARQGSILLTTQLRTLEDLSYTLELPPFPADEGIQFLLHRAKLIDLLAPVEPLPPELEEPALAIVEAVGGLPLALDQAGAYIEQTGCSLKDYLQLFQDHRMALLNERSAMAHHPTSVVKTFLLSFERMIQENEAAADLLRLCAFLAPDAIPEELLTKGASFLGSSLEAIITDSYRFNQMLGEALRYSLLGRQPQNHTLSMHRLVQAVLRDTLSESERRMWVERAVLAVNAAFPEVEHDTWSQCERLLPHTLLVAQYIEQYQIISEEVGHLLNKTATYLRDRAHYAEAKPLYQRAIHIQEHILGLEHPDVATSLYNLAILYRNQGKYAEAKLLFQRALSIREHKLGAEHLAVATSLHGLAILYRKQSKYMEAESLFQRALSIKAQMLGPEHPDVAVSLNSLANIYSEQGKYRDAEPLYQQAIQIWEQKFGPEHPFVANPLNNLANIYSEQGKYREAEPLSQQSLRITEQQSGPEHPDVAVSLNNLANIYSEQGKYRDAEPLYLRALNIREQKLGPEHPDLAYPLTGLASIYREQGRYVEAELLLKQALQIRERQLGPEHSYTAEVMYDLARLREAQGNSEEARTRYTCALTVREQVLGYDHPKTVETRRRLTALLHVMGQQEVATRLEIES